MQISRNMFFKRLLLLLFSFIHGVSSAQSPRSFTSSEILLQVRKLNVLGSVLYVAAHPDDENTRLLSWLSNEKLYRTAYLSITRGDGGQNLLGDEQGVELGLIRTQELLAARRIDGAEQFFTCAYDFGYSKSPDETFKLWDREKVLSDVVWVIRKFRPDIIIARFPTTGEGGHGHHTASAMLAEEAYEAAADTARFPEQLKMGVTVWRPKRLLWNTFNFGSNNTQRDDQFKQDVGAFNPLLGKSYGELAALSRSRHKSQGFGVPAQRGSIIEYFAAIKGEKPVNSLMDGIDISWARTGMPGMEKMVNDIVSAYDVADPSGSVPALLKLHEYISTNAKDDHWKNRKLDEIKNLIVLCSGVYMEATTSVSVGIRGDSLKINASVNCRSGTQISKASVKCLGKEIPFTGLQPNVNSQVVIPGHIDVETPLSQPYWLEKPMASKGRFSVDDQQMIGKPENEFLTAVFSIAFYGQTFEYSLPVLYKFTDPVKGEIFEPLAITDPVSVFVKTPFRLKKGNEKLNVGTELTALQNISLQPGTIKRDGRDFINAAGEAAGALAKDEKKSFEVPLTREGQSLLAVKSGERIFDRQLRNISYDHIPAINYHKQAKTELIPINLKTGRVRTVGYIPGAGDKVAEALTEMGYSVEILKESDIIMPGLKRFDAVVTGVRAFNTNDWLYARNNALMEYVKAGGNLLVQYNTNNWAGPAKGNIGPYPFFISRNRITDENSPVKFLLPDHPVFNQPNKITEKDFDGWVQERSIYHADKIDSGYLKILGLKDPGENEQDGSLIIAPYGKGNFGYTGLAFFRQLPAGVAGAHRLLANLLNLPQNKP